MNMINRCTHNKKQNKYFDNDEDKDDSIKAYIS